jgi:DNA repair exonuclease SbcCD ATPase subunit
MPTGYTADIEKGITFEEYALRCARACIMEIRDLPWDAPIPDTIEDSGVQYHADQLIDKQKQLEEFEAMTDEQWAAAAKAEYEEYRNKIDKWNQEKDELKDKYEAMLAEVNAYEPPSPKHVEYKNFMAQQIKDSIEYDCGHYGYDNAPQSVEAFKVDKLDNLKGDIQYHTEKLQTARQRSEEQTQWVRQLKESIKKHSKRKSNTNV